MQRVRLVAFALAVLSAQAAELHIAAASNLNRALPEIDTAFEKATGIRVVPSFGATAQLTQQIENGAPFAILLAADTEHADELVQKGLATGRAIYARGQLVVWAPQHPELKTLRDLTAPSVRTIVIAKPELAPYGAAAVAALKAAGVWEKVQTRVVYAPSVAVVKQFADSGNGDAAFTAAALTAGETGHTFIVDEKLHQPIDQALCIVKASPEQKEARAFAQFLASPAARAILKRFGYL